MSPGRLQTEAAPGSWASFNTDMTLEIISRSQEQTTALAAAVARLLEPGDAVFVAGQLGTGKTCFIRAACRELGVAEPVTSPSFTMAQTYTGKVTVHHLDLYRLSKFGPEDAVDFEPFFESGAITFVEWPEGAEPYLAAPAVSIHLSHVDEHSRRISFSGRNDLNTKLEVLVAGAGH